MFIVIHLQACCLLEILIEPVFLKPDFSPMPEKAWLFHFNIRQWRTIEISSGITSLSVSNFKEALAIPVKILIRFISSNFLQNVMGYYFCLIVGEYSGFR